MKECKVIKGKYAGREGKCEKTQYGTVMFYSKEGHSPYRVCLKESEVNYGRT